MSWTPEAVEDRVREAGHILKRMSAKGCKPNGHGTSWPDYPREAWWDGISDIEIVRDNAGSIFAVRPASTRSPHSPPSPQEITRLDEFMVWCEAIGDSREVSRLMDKGHTERSARVTATNRRFVLWSVALGQSLRKTAKRIHKSHETVRTMRAQTLERLAARLNEKDSTIDKPHPILTHWAAT